MESKTGSRSTLPPTQIETAVGQVAARTHADAPVMAEEVPTPRQKQYPLWKEYSLLEKAWLIFQDYIPILTWVSLGLLFLYLGSD